ncbi:SSI family serine proteinase inhibitor [Streptomyces sp. 5-10]|uniref:SSI family serine proteinase inhibitor n=1 Tax=Streptomyces sp. 5-10 TaxID=878925 RepID=UPI00168B511C|nr:SSI family serine proteinase inhibitor [Streptomyces sp. 5-10]MBD3004536.1 hypothetical protein [Streptomyces sp. 5-10]
MKLLRRAALLAASMLALSAPAAMAYTPSGSSATGVTHPGAELTMFVTDVQKGYTYSSSLQCMPNGGDHSDPWTACYSLKQADGDFDRIEPLDGEVCTKEYQPVVFTATGHWKGERVYWSKKFANQCEGNIATAGAFDF